MLEAADELTASTGHWKTSVAAAVDEAACAELPAERSTANLLVPAPGATDGLALAGASQALAALGLAPRTVSDTEGNDAHRRLREGSIRYAMNAALWERHRGRSFCEERRFATP